MKKTKFITTLIIFILAVNVQAADVCHPEIYFPKTSSLDLNLAKYKKDLKFNVITKKEKLSLNRHTSNFSLKLIDNSKGIYELLADGFWRGVLSADDMVMDEQDAIALDIKNMEEQFIWTQLDLDGKTGSIEVRKDDTSYKKLFKNEKAWSIAPYPGNTANYIIRKETKVIISDDNQNVSLPRGTKLELDLSSARNLKVILNENTYLPLSNLPLINDDLRLVEAKKAPNGGTIKLSVHKTDFDFRAKKLTFCFGYGDNSYVVTPTPSKNVEFISQSGDVGTYSVEIPNISDKIDITFFGEPANIRAIAIENGMVRIDATAPFRITSVVTAILVSFSFLFVALIVSRLVYGNINLFMNLKLASKGKSGRMSLSNFQILIWSILVFFSLVYVWFLSGELLTLNPEILLLLGIAGGANVVSRGITNIRQGTDFGDPTSPTIADNTAMYTDLVQSDGNVDITRFQMLLFTIFTWGYVFITVLIEQTFPDIPESLFWLMGISNTAYLGAKTTKPKNKSESETLPLGLNEFEKSLTREQIRELQKILNVTESGKLDKATREAIKNYQERKDIVQLDGKLNEVLWNKIKQEMK